MEDRHFQLLRTPLPLIKTWHQSCFGPSGVSICRWYFPSSSFHSAEMTRERSLTYCASPYLAWKFKKYCLISGALR